MEKLNIEQMTNKELLSLCNTINKQINSGMSEDEAVEMLINSVGVDKDGAIEFVAIAQSLYSAINEALSSKMSKDELIDDIISHFGVDKESAVKFVKVAQSHKNDTESRTMMPMLLTLTVLFIILAVMFPPLLAIVGLLILTEVLYFVFSLICGVMRK
jgi:hypothetical protein